MHSYRNTVAILAAAATYPDAQLRQLLTLRIESLAEFTKPAEQSDVIDLGALLQVLVLQVGDTAAAMFDCLGLPCPDPDQPDYYPPWEVIEKHSNWFELTYLRGDDGAGVVVFVPDTADAKLLAMCRMHAIAPGGQP